MEVIGYCRVSTDEQARNGDSLDNQEQRIRNYCEYRGFTLVEMIVDGGVSGAKTREREGFVKVLDLLGEGCCDGLVVYSLDRLSRDTYTLLKIERFFNLVGASLFTVEGLVDTTLPDGWLSFVIKAAFAEFERRQISHRTKRVLEHKKGNGEVVGQVPYGCRREGAVLVAVPSEMEVIERANGLHDRERLTLTQIAHRLNEMGYRTRGGSEWKVQQVKRLLKNYSNVLSYGREREIAALKESILEE